jgi:predicted porin
MKSMSKSLIAAAALLALAAGAQGQTPAPSTSQLNLYGLVDMSYGKSLFADVFRREKADFHSGGDNFSSEGNSTTRVGIKGAVDVGAGYKMNFRFETGGIDSEGGVNRDPDTGESGPFFRRQAWLGASGAFGEVRLGRQDSVPFQVMGEYDFNGQSNGVSALGYSLVAPWLPGRQSRSLQYMTPAFGPVKAHFGFVPKGNRGPDAKAIVSAAAKLNLGDISAAVAYQSKDSSASKDFASIAGSYDFKVVKVSLGYADGGKAIDGGTGHGPSLGVNVPIGSFTVGAQYGQNLDDDIKVRSVEVYANYEVFKNTYAYVEAGNWKTSLAVNPLDAAAKTKGTGYAVGVIFVF